MATAAHAAAHASAVPCLVTTDTDVHAATAITTTAVGTLTAVTAVVTAVAVAVAAAAATAIPRAIGRDDIHGQLTGAEQFRRGQAGGCATPGTTCIYNALKNRSSCACGWWMTCIADPHTDP